MKRRRRFGAVLAGLQGAAQAIGVATVAYVIAGLVRGQF